MGYETPVAMPSMGVYDTDLMKMYIAGVKDQYEKGQEEMKDFMKLYGDFYSDIPGATEAYNNMTIGGARDMINQMMAAGIDPYKSPEARAAISRYIASRDTATLNRYKRDAENAKAYKAAEAKMKANGTWGSDDFQRAMLGGKLLEEWDPNKPFTATSPYEYKDLDALTAQQFAPFKAQEFLGYSRPGYMLRGTKPERIQEAIIAAMTDLPNSAQGQYQIELARKQAEALAAAEGRTLSPEELQAETNKQLYENVKLKADKFFQPKEESDSLQQGKILDDYRTNNDIRADRQKKALDHYYWIKQHPQYDPESPFYIGNLDKNGKPDMTPGSSASAIASNGKDPSQSGTDNWFRDTWKTMFMSTLGTSQTFHNGQVKKLNAQLQAKNGNVKESDAMGMVKSFGVDVPGYFLSKLTGRSYFSGTSSVQLSKSDVNRLYNPKQILGRMVGVTGVKGGKTITGLYNNGHQETVADRQILSGAVDAQNANNKKVYVEQSGPLVGYLNHNGKVKLMIPVQISNAFVSGKDVGKEMLYDTKIYGTLDSKGGFIPDDSCEDRLKRLNEVMTKQSAPVSKTDPSIFD